MIKDDPATSVYGRLLWLHMEEARRDFNGKERERIYNLINEFEKTFPAQCKVWKDRYPGKDD